MAAVELMSQYSEHLSAYKLACEQHPELKSFDATLQHKTNKAIAKIPIKAKPKPVSSTYEVHKHVSQHVVDVTESLTKFITESDHDVFQSKALRDLVEAYFDNTEKTLEILRTIKSCVGEAEYGRLLIQQAVADFERESAEKDLGGKKKRYEETLKNLKKFKKIGDPFDGQVLTNLFEKLDQQQKTLLEEVSKAKEKIGKEISSLKTEILITHVVFGVTAALVIVGSIVALASGVGAIAGITALSGFLITAGWPALYATLDSKREALEKELARLEEMDHKTNDVDRALEINKESMKSVASQVKELESCIEKVMQLVDNAIDNEDDETDTRLVLKLLTSNVDELTEQIKEVGESVENHSKLISEARFHVLEKINSSW
ncbi:hypothetical protein CARUB_v10017451mg [Capsella rubella]|uniref:Uncharacterized protein n=1 Tax=Capsella rubella TaxID=81985 RepID=R0HGF2_9BRAS|nr:UPF0496 protein At3g28270 [Capsella rubella]EOA24215.1 hypothetical protein CARUB_v10017451mg [Capsella rubella]